MLWLGCFCVCVCRVVQRCARLSSPRDTHIFGKCFLSLIEYAVFAYILFLRTAHNSHPCSGRPYRTLDTHTHTHTHTCTQPETELELEVARVLEESGDVDGNSLGKGELLDMQVQVGSTLCFSSSHLLFMHSSSSLFSSSPSPRLRSTRCFRSSLLL